MGKERWGPKSRTLLLNLALVGLSGSSCETLAAPQPAPASTYTAPVPVIEYVHPALRVTFTAPAPVTEYVDPAPAVIELVAPAPAVAHATPAPVTDYASTPLAGTHAVDFSNSPEHHVAFCPNFVHTFEEHAQNSFLPGVRIEPHACCVFLYARTPFPFWVEPKMKPYSRTPKPQTPQTLNPQILNPGTLKPPEPQEP